MNTLARLNPFRSIPDPLAEINNYFSSVGLAQHPTWREFEASRIRIDVTEDANSYRIDAEVPGVDKKDIELSVENNVVSIGAELKSASEEKPGETTLCAERVYGKTCRIVTLPGSVDDALVEAHYEKGVLTVVLPKKASIHIKRVAIS